MKTTAARILRVDRQVETLSGRFVENSFEQIVHCVDVSLIFVRGVVECPRLFKKNEQAKCSADQTTHEGDVENHCACGESIQYNEAAKVVECVSTVRRRFSNRPITQRSFFKTSRASAEDTRSHPTHLDVTQTHTLSLSLLCVTVAHTAEIKALKRKKGGRRSRRPVGNRHRGDSPHRRIALCLSESFAISLKS